jgi:hypothetical protein
MQEFHRNYTEILHCLIYFKKHMKVSSVREKIELAPSHPDTNQAA